MKDETLLQSREHFISLCNKFWNWQELDEITAGEEPPRLEWNGQEFTHRVTQALWRMYHAALQSGNSAQPVTVPDGLRLALSNAGIAAPESDDMLFATHEKYVQLLVNWVKERKPFSVRPGYVLVPAEPTQEMLTASYLFSHVDNTIDSWKAMLAAAPQSPGSQLTTTPGWTDNSDANAALVMLDRIDTLAPEDDDRIEEVKQIIRSLAALKSPDGWIPVSERMPDKDGNYWGWWSESKRQGPAWFIKSELQAQFQSSEITHWRPLPDTPKVMP
ncbi:DUF551 domain-containing protein [Phytobacter ursingii]